MLAPTREDIQAVLDYIEVNDLLTIDHSGIVELDQKLTCPNFRFTFRGKNKTETIFHANIVGEAIRSIADDVIFRGFQIDFDNNSGWGIGISGLDWVVYNIIFNNDTVNTIEGVHATSYGTDSHPRGLVYGCTFNETRMLVYGSSTLMAHHRWNEDSVIGTADAVFVEDCTFNRTFGSCIDSNYGAKYVFRHNTVYNCYAMTHSIQGNNRASRSFEIYENDFISNNGTVWTPYFLRGGTGVVFNNTSTGDWGQNVIALDNIRCFDGSGCDGGLCDGSSLWDSNEEAYGWLGRDQIGAGKDTSLWTGGNPYPAQVKEPAYFWNNTKEAAAPVPVIIHNGCGQWIAENRDYYMIAKPAYTSYTYPHPNRI